MILEFLGRCPCQKYIRLGVIGNNRVDSLVMLLEKIQGNIDLTEFTPYLKMSNKDLSFVDKTTDFEVTTEGEKIKITYNAPAVVTKQKNPDMQLSFEKIIESDTLVWQTNIFNTTFDITIDVTTSIVNEYPDVLKDLNEKIDNVVRQYENKNYFPNVGKVNAVYIDSENNKTYRYDTDTNTYYVVGSDYEDIKIINCNGGKNQWQIKH